MTHTNPSPIGTARPDEPAVTGGVAHCLGGEWPQWCVVEGRGDVVIDGVQVQWVTWLPGVMR